MEAGLQVEDRLAVLDRDDAAGGEAAAVAQPVDVVEDRRFRVAGTKEVGVQRVHEAERVLDRSGGRDEGLAGDLTAEHALAVLLRRHASEQVDLDRFQVEQVDQIVERSVVVAHPDHRVMAPPRRAWPR